MRRNAFAMTGTAFCAMSFAIGLGGCQGVTQPAATPEPSALAQQPAHAVSDEDITDAWFYLLGRLAVLRQQQLDFERDGFHWNEIVHRKPGGVEWANPNLDVVYSEAWISVDEKNCVLLDLPRIEGRYYTWQMLDGWGETILNINERTFPQHPYGRYALCLRGSHVDIPADALRVDLPVRTVRALARIEMGEHPEKAVHLQHEIKLTPIGAVNPEPLVRVPLFSNAKLPRAQAFDFAPAILVGAPDGNPGMDEVRRKVQAVTALVQSGEAGRQRVDDVIGRVALPMFAQRLRTLGPVGNGWIRSAAVGTYGSDYVRRSIIDLVGIWANTAAEVIYFGRTHLDGGKTYLQTFPKGALPQSTVHYFWSVAAVDAVQYKVMPNPLGRYVLNREANPQANPDGSLTLAFGPHKPDGVPESNWLPTLAGEHYALTYRLYGALPTATGAPYYPPPLVDTVRQ
ncbi:DUF1214 domain-containing protein [Paraburkholderia tagetis]|uniref:DUF1214 domain-containing protein n=1 Tax=Paraburkholderia tagetis TaxID=2913261 RepID=A0A9X1RX45_9BURK|nr:DUF1214 domain-containing protein [Paraburkholderia tagetis]MCG5076173.1 DUF1214 domain-containing protein [Paraburkholderia tagetis]